MGITYVNLIESSMIINIPSPSSSSSCVDQTTEHECDDDRVAKLSDRELCHHDVPRLILDNVENEETLNIEFEQLEQLEREVLMIMLAKGLKGKKLENFVGEKGMKLNKLKDLGTGIEESKKCEKGKGINVYDKKLCDEIELLESMLERGSYGLVDLQTMMEEAKGLKGSQKMVSGIKMKISELESELCELKNAIVELKSKKSKELMMGCFIKEEEYKGLKCKKQEYEGEKEKDSTSKIKWGSSFASVGAVAVIVAAVFFVGRSRVEVKSERRNRGYVDMGNF